MNTFQLHYALQRASAHVAAPVMRIAGRRFSKASRDSRLINAVICRVSANLLADHERPTSLREMWAVESRCRDEAEYFARDCMTDADHAQFARRTTKRPLLCFAALIAAPFITEVLCRLFAAR